jgi:hypothetical protein
MRCGAQPDFALRRWLLPSLLLCCSMSAASLGQHRVGSWNIAQLRGEFDAIEAVLSEASLDDTPGFAVPVGIWVFQEVDTDNVKDLQALLGAEYSQGTYTSSGEDTYGGAQAMFYHAGLFTEITSGHDDMYTGAGRRSDRWQLRVLGTSNPPIDLFVYSGHLKASTGSANQAERLFGMEQILENAAELPAGSKIIYAGDYNIYTNSEPAYEALVAPGPVAGIDPYGNGSWSGSSNGYKHTQSPRASAGGGLIGGSLDDRFDFHVHTAPLGDGMGVDYMSGTLRPLGNDGNHFDEAINAGTNTYFPGDAARSNALADALHDASDHIPVMADYTESAVVGAAMSPAFDTVILGGPIELTLVMSNDVDVVVPEAGADLHWTATGTGVLAGVSESGVVASGATPSTITVEASAAVAGAVTGTLVIESPDGDTIGTGATVTTTGTVLRHANASFSDEYDSNFLVVPLTLEADSGIQPIDVELHNYGWDFLQARLDFDGVDDPLAPFNFLGEPQQDIGFDPVTLPFVIDTDGLAAGQFVENLTLTVSDEDYPGATVSTLTLVLSVEITDVEPACPGDYSGDGVTNVSDLLLVISEWGTPYDVTDLLAVIGDWDCSSSP